MGMFDYVRSSFDLGEQFTNVELQTKDLSCLMSHYWINPAGELYEIDYSYTADMVELPESESFYPFEWVPNGTHGKVTPVYVRQVVRMYPTKHEGNWEEWPDVYIYFKYGKIEEFWTEPRKTFKPLNPLN